MRDTVGRCADPQKLDQKSNDWRSVLFWQNIFLNLKKVVQAYLDHEGSYASLAKKFGIASGKDIRKWVNAYKAFGDDRLKRSRENKKYTFI